MSGILTNLLKPENMDRLALGFNQLRMQPDAGLATTIQNRQALRQQQQGRDAAMEFFQGKPGADAYIAALGAGADGPSTIQSFITAQNAAARSNVGTVARNRTIELLDQRCEGGEEDACRMAAAIKAGGSAAQILGIYAQKDASGSAVQSTKEFGRGLSKVTLKNGTSNYFLNGVELNDRAAIEQAIAAEKAFDNEQAGDKKRAEAEGTGAGRQMADINAAIRGVGERFEATLPLIQELIKHPGMDAATGSIGGLKPITAFQADNPAKEFITKYNQLAGKIFLSAFEGLKGGGQITELEGQKAQEAASNISRQLDPPALKNAMRSYIESLQAAHARLIAQRTEMQNNSDPTPIDPARIQFPDL